MTTAAPQEQYEFTNEWFVQNIPVWDTLVPRFNPRRILEIGSYEGRSTCYFIQKVGELNEIEVHCIDTWEGGVEHDKSTMSDVEARFDRNIARARQAARNPAKVVKYKKYSNIALAEIIASGAPQFDVVYVDGSHQAPDVLTDCIMSFQLLRVGGLMIFDDYIWSMEPMGKQDLINMPKLAIDAFLNVFQRKMQIVRGAPVYQLYAAKVGA